MADSNKGWENIKGHSFADMDDEKQKIIATAGGRASGEARRKKKRMKEQLETLLSLPVQSEKAIYGMECLGIDEEDMNNQMALLVAMFKKGVNGNVHAFNAIRDTLGEYPNEAEADEENISNFLQAMNPTQDDLDNLFADEVEEGEDNG